MSVTEAPARLRCDPLRFAKALWPDVKFYREQRQIIDSVLRNDETVVPAGHQLGKDFVTGFIALWYFLTHHPCRVVTTSVKDDHLRILWGEIGRFIDSSRFGLTHKKGGTIQVNGKKIGLIVNHREVKKVVDGQSCKVSYLIGTVSEKGEGMAGHHAAHTLLIIDEASGAEDLVYERATTWAKRVLVIGNPYPTANFFRRGVKDGDQVAPDRSRLYRRVIRVRAEDSPNVRLALAEKQGGKLHSGRVIVPGVLSWDEYTKRRATWDAVRQAVGLDAVFYEGAEALLFPPAWLNHSERLDATLSGKPRRAKAIGIDPGEGGANTAMAAVDEHGLIELLSRRTPDTSVIAGEAIAFGRRHQVPAEDWVFDAGGGGKQIAHLLRSQGHAVRVVAFGEAVTQELRRTPPRLAARQEVREDRLAYKNRRAQMAGELRELIDPSGERGGWAIPAAYFELRRQMAPIPLTYDHEGRLALLPKSKRSSGSNEKTLTELLGCSPDEFDSVCLATHGLLHKVTRVRAGAF